MEHATTSPFDHRWWRRWPVEHWATSDSISDAIG